MFSAEDYTQGWIAYVTGASFLLLFLWLLLRKSAWVTVRHLVLLVAASFLLTPVPAYRDDSHLAPAFFVRLYEGVMVSGADAGFQRGLAPIIAVALFAILFYLLARLLWAVVAARLSNKHSTRKQPSRKDTGATLRGAKLNPKQDLAE